MNRMWLAGAAGVGAAACAVGLMATSAWLISRAAQQPPVLYLMVAIVAVRAFGIGRGVLRYAERLASHDAAFRLLGELRVRVYQKLETLAPSGLAAFRSGDLMSRLVADVDSLQDRWLRVRLPYTIAAIVGAASVLLVGWLLPSAGAVLAVSLVVVGLLGPMLSMWVSRRAQLRVAPMTGELTSGVVDLLHGAPELVACGAAEARLAELDELDRRLVRAHRRTAIGAGLGAALASLAAGAAVWLALVLGVNAVRDARLDGVALAVVVLTPLAVHELFAGLAAAAQLVPRVRAAQARVDDVLARPDPVAEPTTPEPVPAGPYGLRVRGLVAGWPDGPDVLHGVDLEVRPGERVAVVGPSGVGKSTLAFVLLRFLDARRGSVELLGASGAVPLGALDGDAVRRVVGLCAQDAHLFDSTLAANLRIARPSASDAELRDALGRARLLDWVDSLPDGLDTTVGEHGLAVSGGQRQRIALARVLLADFPVLVLDEPTEHLDEPTAVALLDDLLLATADRAVVLVTHRERELASFDSVVRLDAVAVS